MQNIIEILKGIGVEVPADKTEELNKQLAANYKTVAEHQQKIGRLEQERDGYKAPFLCTAPRSAEGDVYCHHQRKAD